MNNGSLEYLLTLVQPEHEQLLVGISELTDTLLWICPGVDWNDLALRFKLDEAFPKLRAITWHHGFQFRVSPLGPEGGPGKNTNEYWAPGEVELIAVSDGEILSSNRIRFTRIAWAPQPWPESWKWLSRFPRREISFIPDTEQAAARWARVAFGLSWLQWLSPMSEPDPPFEWEAVLRTYIRTTLLMGGVAVLQWTADTYSGLLCFGAKDQLEDAAQRLKEQGARVATDLGFARLWQRGLYLAVESGYPT